MNDEAEHMIRRFVHHLLVHIHQKKNIALEIAAQIWDEIKRGGYGWTDTRTDRRTDEQK
jgi:hypothetical protein